MKKQVLTIDQMRHLQSLGIDTSKANMYWKFIGNPHYKIVLSIVSEHRDLKSCEERNLGLGAFTLQDMLNILPCHIDKYVLGFNQDYKGQDYDLCHISYTHIDFPNEHLKVIDTGEGGILNASYEMLCWCAKNNKI